MADLLSEGKIIGTVRGRTEFGPRALGHRSLLAFPTEGMKDRMNRLKVREWFRPVAPVFTYEVSCDADAIISTDTTHPFQQASTMSMGH